MHTKQVARPGALEREVTIKRQVVRRTGGRIQMLEVEVSDDRVVVRGRVGSYYLKQLALQGVLDVLGPTPMMRIELNVEVVETRSV
jgi:hypothetical protein